MEELFVIGTPIGNLQDLSPRAKQVLQSISLLFCEDTRVTKKLLQLLDIPTPQLVSINKFSEYNKIHSKNFIKLVESHKNVGLVSDAGMPGVSDPGMLLVDYAHKTNTKLTPVPGPCALGTLISVSGINANSFYFAGFLPHTKSKKRKYLIETLQYSNLFVFYDAPTRIRESLYVLREISEEYNLDLEVVIGRELTKHFEEIIKLNLKDLDINNIKEKGEYAVTVKTTSLIPLAKNNENLKSALADYLNISKKEAYKKLIELKNSKAK